MDTKVAYGGDASDYGQSDDPMVGNRIGGVNVFGGGLALYNAQGQIVGGIGRERGLVVRGPQYRVADEEQL